MIIKIAKLKNTTGWTQWEFNKGLENITAEEYNNQNNKKKNLEGINSRLNEIEKKESVIWKTE